MKKLLVVTETFFPENFLINDLVQQWQRDGYQVDILTQWPSYPHGRIYAGYQNQYYAKEKWGTSTIHRFRLIEGYKESKIKKILNYWVFVRVGTKIAKKIGREYDHIVIHQTGPLTLALPAIAIKKKFHTPITIWTFDIWPDAVYAYGFPKIKPLEWFLNAIIRKVYRNCDHILVSSQKFAETIQPYVVEKKIEYAPNWLLPQKFIPSTLQLTHDKVHFTFTGNISISQNLENVIRGFAAAHLSNAQLNIIGDGVKRMELENIVKHENLSNIIFHGAYPYNQMDDILQQSNMLVLPLIADPGIEKTEPFKLQSYLMAGKPILGIVRGSAKEIIEREHLGLCADPSDIQSIANSFNEALHIIENPSLLKNIQQRAYHLMNTRFNRDQIIQKINSIIGMEES